MHNKKMIVFILLMVTALISLVYGILTPSKIRRQIKEQSRKDAISRLAAGGQKGPSQTAAPGPPGPGVAAATTIRQRPSRSQYQEWGRNPFLRQDILELKGILWDDKTPKAVINENIVAVGDLVSGSLVVDIQKDRVILYDGSSDFELKLKE